jgi:hypothetical protein
MNRQFICSMLIAGLIAGTSFGLAKETSLVTGKTIGNLAVAGKAKAQNYKPSTIAEVSDKEKIKNLMGYFVRLWKPDKTVSEVKIKSGPIHNAKLEWNELGTQWIVESGKYEIKLSIENGVDRSIEDFMNVIRCMPKPILWGLSEGKPHGVQIRDRLGGGSGGCASGSGVFLAQGPWQSLAGCLIHEASHTLFNVADRLTKTRLTDEWVEAMAADDISISSYGDGRWGEDVAEFGKIYFISLMAGSKKHFGNRTALEELERLSPQRFAAFKAIIQEPLEYSQPVAEASNQSITDTDNNGSEKVTLDASKSKDKDGAIVQYYWYKGRVKIASGISPTVKLPVGDHKIILLVTDNKGYVDDRRFVVNVVDATSAKAVALDIVAVKASKAPNDHTKEHTIDKNMGTRWSVHGKGNWLQYDLGKAKTVSSVSVAWFSGASRAYYFTVEVSKDGVSWSEAYSGESTKTTNEQEHYRFKPVKARYVKLIGQGNSNNAWNNISEFGAWGAGEAN